MKKHILYAIPLFASCLVACSDWDDHFNNTGSGAAGSNTTLWQQIKENPDLSDFAHVLEETKIFRQHKKTSVSYAQLLDGGQSFTVVAPVNGTFNKDTLLNMVKTAQGDSIVEKSFVLNHLSRSLTSTSQTSKRMLLLNGKYAEFEEGLIEGVALTASNQRAKNGILHIAASPLEFERNLYEMLCDHEDLTPIGAALRDYEEDYFDADQSVSSGIVEGVPVYVDSVIIERNKMVNHIGYINREDSCYWVAVPSKDAWNETWEETQKYFVYDGGVLKRDSLQHYWTTFFMLSDGIFNPTLNTHPQDSLMSDQYVRGSQRPGKPMYHVFQKPFDEGGILQGAEEIQCSNGVIYKTPTWPFTPEETFFRQIWVEGESTWQITEDKLCIYNGRRLAADSISESGYLQILPEKNTSNWELTFRLDNTLSAHYDICAVVLPRSITHPNEAKYKPCKFKAYVNYVDEEGKAQTFNCGNKQFTPDPLQVDTVVLAESFYLPACNYGETDIKVSLKLQCSIIAREQSSYSREMYLDCIYLRPRRDVASNEE